MKTFAGLLLSLICVAAAGTFGIALHRIDRQRNENQEFAREIKAEIERVRIMIPAKTDETVFTAQLQVCKARTEWLRIVLETFVPLNDRVRLPDPPPGWQRWPAPNPNE